MMLRRILLPMVLISVLAGAAAPAGSVSAAPMTQFAVCANNGNILGMPYWYNNLTVTEVNGGCNVQFTKLTDLWVIVLNILQAVITAAGYIAVGFIIWGGIKFIKSQGDPGQINESRDTIVNASIGLVIVLASVAIINFVTANIAG